MALAGEVTCDYTCVRTALIVSFIFIQVFSDQDRPLIAFEEFHHNVGCFGARAFNEGLNNDGINAHYAVKLQCLRDQVCAGPPRYKRPSKP